MYIHRWNRFGFNAGSALSANLRAIMAAVVTNLAACVGGMTWCIVDYRLEKKWSTVGFCSGVISGLVAITPGSGYVPAWSAVVYGVLAGLCCNFATKLKYWISADDALDIFAVHAVGGVVGNLCTGAFAADYIAHLDGYTVIPGGWLNGHWIQMATQLADSASGMGYSFVMTTLILVLMSLVGRVIPAMRLRVDREGEETGIDDTEIGEFAYDYVELLREVRPAGVIEGEEDESVVERAHSRTAMMPIPGDKQGHSYPLQPLRYTPEDRRRYSGAYKEPHVSGGGIGLAT